MPTTAHLFRPLLAIAAMLLLAPSATVRASGAAPLHEARQGRLDARELARLREHPLHGWLRALSTQTRLRQLRAEDVRIALLELGPTPAGDHLRGAWLATAAARGDWNSVLSDSRQTDDPALQCLRLDAEHRLGRHASDWNERAIALYRHGERRPPACEAVFTALQVRGALDADLRWDRIMLAAEAGQTRLIPGIASGLPADQAGLALAYVRFLDAPGNDAATWPVDERGRRIASLGLQRLARRDAGAAEALLGRLSRLLPAGQTGHGEVRAAIALWSAANFAPEASARLARVPKAAFDDVLHGWAVRTALSRRDERGALAAITAMPTSLRSQSQWRYLEGRLRERAGQTTEALTLYVEAATESNFSGFLAADRAGLDYRLCAEEPSSDPALRSEVAALPGLQRALALFRQDEGLLAAREWQALVADLDEPRRRLAVAEAIAARWYDRAVFGLDNTQPETLRHYSLRFPLHHGRTLQREAERNGLDPAYVAGLARAESIFMPRARSHADARGLMQLLPSTAQGVAQRLKQPWTGADSLYRPAVNITLGTAYLRERLAINGGRTYRATAAYNAGQGAVARWLAARPDFEPEFWIETIPYRETRDYVPRVLAFSVIYDWRLHGDARPLDERMRGIASTTRKQFSCPPTLPASQGES